MREVAPEGRDTRPPITSLAAPRSGAASPSPRPTVAIRPSVSCVLGPAPSPALPPTDPYVRRYWVAAVGPTAVADLLRMHVAARQARALKRPIGLHMLLEAGLVHALDGRIVVPEKVRLLGRRQIIRLNPRLRREHARWLAENLARAWDGD